jgi:glycosyltransferase involved in cell wall biosynthesis
VARPTVSAIVLTQNEEDHVAECLARHTWCDERIVVDLPSQDRTRERAEPLATKILLHAPIPNFPRARNIGIDAAVSDWIFVVDVDEIVPDKLVLRLLEHLENADDTVGFWIPRMNYCFGRPVPHVGGFPDYQLRCFRRGAGHYPGDMHRGPQFEGRTVFLPIEEGVWFLHQRKNASIGDLVRKWDRYAEVEARDSLNEGCRFPGPLAMLWAGISTFRARFITLRGYKDGVAGLVMSVMFGFYRFEVEAKRWEASGAEARWDPEVRRLSSLTRLLWALVGEARRRLWNAVGRR